MRGYAGQDLVTYYNTYSFAKDTNTTPSTLLLRNPRYPYDYLQNKESNEKLICSLN